MAKIVIVLGLFVVFISCAKNTSLNSPEQSFDVGTDSTLDIITWNIKNFPKQNDITIDYLAELIDFMNVDIIAMQEIGSEIDFNKLVNKLDEWTGYRANSAYYNIDLAYLYKLNITINKLCEIEELDDYNIPRTPLLLEIYWEGENIYIINNHFKALGDGIIDNIYNDEEYRRQQASILTKNYIDSNFDDENVILLGDFNDELSDQNSANVFMSFIEDSENYKFVDMNIAFGSSYNLSYPSYPSHIDHILITNELFDEFKNPGSNIQTIHLENYFDDGWNDYENYISDHRPVGLSLNFNP